MNRLRDEMKIIPRPVYALSVLLTLGILFGVVAFQLVEVDSGSNFGFLPLFAILIFIGLSFSIYILLVGYIYGDARRRGMRPVLWALLAFFIPNAIGIILYFILREPLLVNCPKCGAGTKSAFPFCPSCGTSLAYTCPSCRSAIESGWSHCPRCGTPQNVAQRLN
jgi:double zinc ribbon protein